MSDETFITSCLQAHNKYRRRHGAPPLKHNQELSTMAQKWAEHLAKTGNFMHNQDRKYKGQVVGENLAMKWTTYGEKFTGDQVTSQWYNERKNYNYNKHNFQKSGHFTQVIWKESRDVGFGKAKSDDGKWFVVGNYFPSGNLQGQFEANVVPPLAGDLGPSVQEELPLINEDKDLPCCACCGCSLM